MKRFTLAIIAGLTVACAVQAPYVPPRCIKSHLETVPAHLVIYAYNLHIRFVAPQVTAYWAPESQVERCDKWIGGF